MGCFNTLGLQKAFQCKHTSSAGTFLTGVYLLVILKAVAAF